MRIAMSSYTGYGSWFVYKLLQAGHKVDYYLSEPKYANILGGIIPPPILIHGKKGYKNIDYSKYDLSLFDMTGREQQAEYSASLCPTIGDGSLNCALEDDRLFGIQTMEECEIQVPPYESFTDVNAAKEFIRKTNKRYVYKPSGNDQDTASTYVSEDAEDMLGYIDRLFSDSGGTPFILQEFIKGTEVSLEGYFNGEEFYLINCTLEEKKFMCGGKGPNTGCAGNLVFNFGSSEPLLYREGLAKLKPFLKRTGYTGMIDLNTIITKSGLFALEFTPRFGYDASACFIQLYGGDFWEMLLRISLGESPDITWKAEFAASIRISIPPYPSEIPGEHPAGVPIKGIESENYDSTFIYDVCLEKNEVVSAGVNGLICAPMEIGNSIGEVFAKVEDRMKKIKVPQAQYRTDIKKSVLKRYTELDLDGWFK